MALSITVSPVASGWVLRSGGPDPGGADPGGPRPGELEAGGPEAGGLASEQFFTSGGRAEAAARRLAARLAGAGRETEVEIVLRDGAVAGRVHFPARGAR